MLVSQLFLHTTKEDPRGTSSPSHRLLMRAGYLQPLSSGIYCYSPLLWRVIRKAEQIVREEMDRIGAVELCLPILQPRSLWDETERWDVYRQGGNLFHLRDRKGEDLCLAPTAEEVITHYVRQQLRSHRELPTTLYQFGRKFRDEVRPRFGIIRGREFVMKDAYSFDLDEAGMRHSYELMREAYQRVCERCGFDFLMVEADSGAIGGSGSAEFMVLASTGEDTLLKCSNCTYGANVDKAESMLTLDQPEDPQPMEVYDTPNIRTVEELTEFFNGLPASKMVKTIIYQADNNVAAVCIRGDLEINEVKLANVLGATELATAEAATVESITGAEVGFAGPVGLKGVRILADTSVQPMANFLCGRNETDRHLLNVNHGRDFPTPAFHDLRVARPNDGCPRCQQGKLTEYRGIEMGHIFMLQTKYSDAMGLTYQDADGQQQVVWMGCYGIGVSRIAAAAVEQLYDDDGIVWPESLAPYRFIVVPVSWQNQTQRDLAKQTYHALLEMGHEVLLDDRDLAPGVKFKDADLIGIPWRLTVGRGAPDGIVELRNRKDGSVIEGSISTVLKLFTHNPPSHSNTG